MQDFILTLLKYFFELIRLGLSANSFYAHDTNLKCEGEQLCWLDRWEPLTVSNENTMAYEFEFGIFVLIVISRDCSGKSALISRRKVQISDKYDELTVSTYSIE
jgi:hypothetical protein